MLKDLAIASFRCHQTASIAHLRPFSVIVGRNNSGKSALLQALAYPRFSETVRARLNNDGTTFRGADSGTIEIGYTPPHSSFSATERRAWRGKISRDGRIDAPAPGSREQTDLELILTYIGIPRIAPLYYPFGPYSGSVGKRLGIDPWMSYRETHEVNPEARAEIRSWADRVIGGFEDLRTPSASQTQGRIEAKSHGYYTDIARQGDGAGAVLPVIIQSSLCQRGQTLIVEEPDLHLHAAAVVELVGIFRTLVQRGVQVVCSTHSLDFVAALENWAFVDENTPPSDGLPPGSYGLYEVSIPSEGKSSIREVATSDPSQFQAVRAKLSWGV